MILHRKQKIKKKTKRFIEFILTEKELKEYEQRKNDYLYGRFAAKEAIMKLLRNTKELSFHDIEILTNSNGEPYSNFSNISISISHEKNYTIAVALLNDN